MFFGENPKRFVLEKFKKADFWSKKRKERERRKASR
jgi:hypothetical protein